MLSEPAELDPYKNLVDLVGHTGGARVERLLAMIPDLTAKPYVLEGRAGVNLYWGHEEPVAWVGAHHDIDPWTPQGALDNTAALAILVSMILSGRIPANVGVAFWDGEEPGGGGGADGSSVHAAEIAEAGAGGGRVPPVVVLDVLGRGRLMMAGNWNGLEFLREMGDGSGSNPLELVPVTPPSDHVAFLANGVPSALLVAMPRLGNGYLDYSHWDILHSDRDNIGMASPTDMRQQMASLHAFLVRVATHEVTQPGRRVVSEDVQMQAAEKIKSIRPSPKTNLPTDEEWREMIKVRDKPRPSGREG
ncbi:MAG: M28 family peptidase [Gemmatimonadales bacterium]|nr:M28 family peptidase [Gemmatimonadales bacterium]